MAYALRIYLIEMNITDFFIIYLACGAPCGVYFFLQNRKKLDSKALWLKSFVTVFVWIPYACVLLFDFIAKRKQARLSQEKSAFETGLLVIQKQLIQLHLNSPDKISLFEFREILERYAGLTIACNTIDSSNPAESEIFRIAIRENSQIGVACLNRRNRERLIFHQKMAREDFLQVISALSFSVEDIEPFQNKVIEFVELLNDTEALYQLNKVFAATSQSSNEKPVSELEKEVWKPKETNRQTSSIPIHLKAFTAVTSRKD